MKINNFIFAPTINHENEVDDKSDASKWKDRAIILQWIGLYSDPSTFVGRLPSA